MILRNSAASYGQTKHLTIVCLMFILIFSACDRIEHEEEILETASSVRRIADSRMKARVVIDEAVRKALLSIQKGSISENVEYCGYIVQNGKDVSVAGPVRGTSFGCRTPIVYKPSRILASFHTHGAADPNVLTEIPSSIDFDAVARESVNGYIGTPGGRIWKIDHQTMIATVICGPEKCLPQDLNISVGFVPTSLTKADVIPLEVGIPLKR